MAKLSDITESAKESGEIVTWTEHKTFSMAEYETHFLSNNKIIENHFLCSHAGLIRAITAHCNSDMAT